jgi:uncharacterized protein
MRKNIAQVQVSLAYIRNLAIFGLLTLAIGLLSAFSVLSYQYADTFVNHPRNRATITSEQIGFSDYETVNFVTEDGLRLDAWFIAPIRKDGATFIFLHGHGGNRSDLLSESVQYLEQGYGALYFDFRAHGTSEGDAITMAVNEVMDVQAAFNFLLEQDAVNPERIALYGQSMGAAVAIRSAAIIPEIRVVIADSSYTSMRDAFADGIPPKTGLPPLFLPEMIIFFSNQLSGANFYDAAPIDVIDDLTQPIFLLQGRADGTVFYTHAERLYEAANEPKVLYIVEGAGHIMAYETNPQAYQELMYPFLERYFTNK